MDFLDDILVDTAVDISLMTIEQLKREVGWPLDYTATLGIAPYIRRLGSDISGVEIGTGRGEGAYHLVEACPGIKTLYTIDPYLEYEDWNGTVKQETLDKQKMIALENFKKFDNIIPCHETSSEAASKFEDDSQYFLFIDGKHNTDAVYEDLSLWYTKVKKNGIVSGSSYGLRGVQDGLGKWRSDTKNRYPIMTTSNNVWFFYKR